MDFRPRRVVTKPGMLPYRPPDEPRYGECLLSLVFGVPAIVLGLVSLSALLGFSVPGLSVQTIKFAYIYGAKSGGKRLEIDFLYLPGPDFWVLATTGLVLAAAGVYLVMRKTRRWPVACLVGITLSFFALFAGYILSAADSLYWR